MARRAVAVALMCVFVLGTVPGRTDARSGGCDLTRLSRARGRAEPYTPDPGEAAAMMADPRWRSRAGLRLAGESKIDVPVWVHVLRAGRLGAGDRAVKRQVAVLNKAYGGRLGGPDTGVRFHLAGITHTSDRRWFRDPLGSEVPLKTRLRRGGAETLNLYVAQLSEIVLGYSTYPYRYAENPILDGVVIDWRTLPGGSMTNFDRGLTSVHEIGHWMGLLHTFENGCGSPGDYVADTPPESEPTRGCPPRKDSCPAGGDDPVHNFMDYSYDRCMSHFTLGQVTRMHEMWSTYRKPHKV